MTRRAGFVPVRLSRNSARQICRWLGEYRPLEPTILGSVGIPADKLEASAKAERELIAALKCALVGARTGRPRFAVSTYHLPVAALRLIDNGWAALQMSDRLRPKIRRMLRAIYRQRGPKLPRSQRLKNLQNGVYSPETERKYLRLLAKTEPPKAAPRIELKDAAIHLSILPRI